MKSIFIGLILVLTFSNAYAKGAVGALKKIFGPGVYHGQNIYGDCFLTVREVNYPDITLNVEISDSTGTLAKLINDNAIYAEKVSKKAFYQSDRITLNTKGDYIEKYLRVFSKLDKTIRVTVSEMTVVEKVYDENIMDCDIAY